MNEPKFVLFYVEDPAASTAFYVDLLGRQPIESSPNFAMFALESGFNLGLWSRHKAEPSPTVTGGGGEIGFFVADADTVLATCADWRARGLPIVQEPTEMDFGHTFVALDPDGHRLRVMSPSGT